MQASQQNFMQPLSLCHPHDPLPCAATFAAGDLWCCCLSFAATQLGENIQVLLLPIKGLSAELTRLKQQNGWAIDSRLLAFSLGLDFAADSTAAASN
jgi:hypothetical protein